MNVENINDNPKFFIKRLLGFSFGPVIGSIISFIIVPISTWLVIPEEFGKSSMYITIQQLSILVIALGLDQSFVREFSEEKNKQSLLFHSFFLPFFICIFTIMVLLIFYKPFSFLIFDENNFYGILILSISILFSLVYNFSAMIIRMEENAFLYSMGQIAQRLVYAIVLFILLFTYKRNYEVIIFSNMISIVVVAILQIYVTRRYWKFKIEIKKELFIKLFNFGFPLLFTGFFAWILNSMDKVALRIWSDFHEIGIYATAFRFTAILLVVKQAFVIFWVPTAYKWYNNNITKERFEKVSRILTFFVILLFILITIFRNFLKIVIESEYHNAINILPLLLIVPIMYLLSETTSFGINFSRKTIYTVFISGVAAIANLIGNYILVPRYGAVGAAISTAISFFIFFWLRTIVGGFLWKFISIKYHIFSSLIICILIFGIFTKYEFLFVGLSFVFLILININVIKELKKIVFSILKK